jgi:hypothetical protein
LSTHPWLHPGLHCLDIFAGQVLGCPCGAHATPLLVAVLLLVHFLLFLPALYSLYFQLFVQLLLLLSALFPLLFLLLFQLLPLFLALFPFLFLLGSFCLAHHLFSLSKGLSDFLARWW